MKDSRFIGTGVAIVTPFKDNSVDFVGLQNVINHVIDGGVDYIVALGSTGESATLSEDEARKVLDFCIREINGRVPLVAGNFGGNDTAALVRKLKSYNFDGITAILSSSPAYSKPTQEGIFQHYKALADVCPVPIILYNVPGRTSSNMEWMTTVRLANYSSKFIGIKEASGNLIQVTKIINHKPDHFLVISGDDELVLPLICMGGDGVISVITNALPNEFSTMIRTALNGNFKEAAIQNASTYPLHQWLYIEGNPVGIKAAMETLDICAREVRLPLSNMTDDNFQKLKAAMNQIKNLSR